MSDIGNRDIFSVNLRRYIERSGKMQKDIADAIGVSTSALSDWAAGRRYPRIDKIEKLADYFGIAKSDLIEDKSNPENDYYLDAQAQRRAQELADRPELGLLFDASRKLNSADIAAVIEIVNRMTK